MSVWITFTRVQCDYMKNTDMTTSACVLRFIRQGADFGPIGWSLERCWSREDDLSLLRVVVATASRSRRYRRLYQAPAVGCVPHRTRVSLLKKATAMAKVLNADIISVLGGCA